MTPLSYKVFLEQSIGNHDENFLKGYHDMLEGFSHQVMEYTAKYCKEKITEMQQQNDTRSLSISTPKKVFTEIKKTLAVNQTKRVKTLKDIKGTEIYPIKIPLKLYYAKTNTTIFE